MTDTSTDPGISNPHKYGTQQPTELIDLLQVVTDNFGVLFFGSVGTGLVALAIAFLMPPTFTAKTTLMPPSSNKARLRQLYPTWAFWAAQPEPLQE